MHTASTEIPQLGYSTTPKSICYRTVYPVIRVSGVYRVVGVLIQNYCITIKQSEQEDHRNYNIIYTL